MPTFAEEVAKAAAEAGIKEDAPEPMTQEEESLPAEEYRPANALLSEAEPTKEEATEAAKPEEPAKEEPKQEPPQTVPLAVHIRQRERFEREQQELRRAVEVGNQRLAELARALQPEQKPVDRNTDPLGAALQQMDGLSQEVQETRKLLAQREQEEHTRRQLADFQNRVVSDEQVFATQQPDYPDAVRFAKDMKYREYIALGLDPHQAGARVQQDAFALAQHAMQQGMSPAELAYRMASALGYRKAHVAQTQQEETHATTKSQAEETVQMRAAGAQRGKGTGGASATTGAISLADLAAMDNEEFAKMTSGKKWEKLLRGA
jgi:hypothetical protein